MVSDRCETLSHSPAGWLDNRLCFTYLPAMRATSILRHLFWLCLAGCGCAQPHEEPARIVPQVSPVQPRRVQLSPIDGSRLLVLEVPGLVGLWDVANPARPTLYASIAAGAIDTCFASDGRSLVTVGLNGRVRWWTDQGQPAATSNKGHAGPARTVAATAGLVASGGDDGTIRLWKPDGSPAGEPLQAHAGAVVSLDFSPRGDLVSVGADETIRWWKHITDSSDPGQVAYESSELYRQSPPKLTPERYLHLVKYDVHWGWDHSIAWAQHGDLIAASAFDGALRLWNGDGSARRVLIDAHQQGLVRAVALSAAGDIVASAGFNGELRLWNADGSARAEPIRAHGTGVSSVSFSPRGDRLVTTGLDDRVRFWSPEGISLGELPAAHADRVLTVAFSPQAPAFAVADKDGVVRLWDLTGRPRGRPLAAQKDAGYTVAFSPRGDFVAAGGGDGAVHLWDTNGLPIGKPALGKTGAVFALAFSPDGSKLAVGTQTLELRDEKGTLWQQPLVGTDRATTVTFAPSGAFVALGSVLGRLQVWNTDGSDRTPAFKLPREHVWGLAVGPDGSFLASCGGEENIVRLWNLDGTSHGAPLEGHLAPVRALASLPSQSLLASGSDDGTVRLWHFPKRESDVIDIGLPVNQLGFWRDLLWVRANDDSVFFYDNTHRLVATIILRRDAVLTFTPQGWVSGTDGAMRFVRAFGDNGELLSGDRAAARFSPKKVTEALMR